MAFKKTRRRSNAPDTPEALFRDLRDRSVQGLLSQQADMLRAYSEVIDEEDVALQLPTGSGKTLVGLLIAEWRRRRKSERIAFLCPTKQLVHQVVAQSSEYGIKARAFTGPQSKFSAKDKGDYQAGDVVAVSTYSSLFNINPFFDDANALILDDAHAAETYVAAHWTVEINKHEHAGPFKALVGLLAPKS